MEIKQVATLDLAPYEKNAKKHSQKQIEQVAQSIKQFGWAQPLAVDKYNVLIIGHCRWEAAKSLGLETVPVVYMENLTPAQTKTLRLADNKLNESGWEMDLVIDELKWLQSQQIDVSSTGFDIDALLPDTKIETDADQVDEDYQTYLNNTIKQIVLYFQDQDYESVLARMQQVHEAYGVDNNTDAFLALLEFYENNRGKKEDA